MDAVNELTHERPARTAIVIVASTSGAAGTRTDATGPVIRDWLAQRDFAADDVVIVADAAIAEALEAAVRRGPSVVITTGGTGVSPSDQTPEATRRVLDRELPGISEAIRARGLAATPLAALSRALAGVAGATVVINLPGSTGGVRDGLGVLDEILDHVIAQVAGGGSHE